MTIEDNSEPYSVPMPDGSFVYAVRQKAPACRPVMTLRGRTDGKIEILVDGRPLSDAGLLVQNLKVEVDAAGGTTVRLQCPFERVELDLSGPGTVFRRQTDGDQMRRVAAAIQAESAGYVSRNSVSDLVRTELERSKAVAERAAEVVKDFRQQQFYAPNLGEPHAVVAGGYEMESTEFVSTLWRCTMPTRYPLTDDAGNQVGWSDGSPFDAEGLAKALRDAAPADDDGFEGPRIVEGSP